MFMNFYPPIERLTRVKFCPDIICYFKDLLLITLNNNFLSKRNIIRKWKLYIVKQNDHFHEECGVLYAAAGGEMGFLALL